MAKKGGNPQNLTPGNPGNRGGGVPLRVRESKQAFLDAINETRIPKNGEESTTVANAIKERIVQDALDPKNPGVRIWLSEMQHGKPQSKVELVIGTPELLHALSRAIHEADIEPAKGRMVLEKIRGFLSADAEQGV